MAAAKPDSKEKDAPADKAGAASTAGTAPAKSGGLKVWLPVLAAIIVAPGATFAVAQFVLLPKLKAELAASAETGAAGHAPAPKKKAEGEKKEKGGHGGKEGEGAKTSDTYEFANVVVNLSGTMGTRYLKTSFVVTGAKPDTIKDAFVENKARLTDVTLGVLSSLSLSDLEEPGAKNVLREKLVTAYNPALGSRVADQVYFSDFVVQ
jgi:flagellar FliL protein